MAKLHQYDFYYGAILNTIISQNPDACPTLLEIGEEKSVYKVTTNSSEKDIIIFCKYATVKNNKSDNYKSWTFAFSDTDKDCIKKYHDKKYFFAMNGQTGKIQGILPISTAKLLALAAGLLVVVGTIAGFIGGALS